MKIKYERPLAGQCCLHLTRADVERDRRHEITNAAAYIANLQLEAEEDHGAAFFRRCPGRITRTRVAQIPDEKEVANELAFVELTPNRALRDSIAAWFEHYPDLRVRPARMSPCALARSSTSPCVCSRSSPARSPSRACRSRRAQRKRSRLFCASVV